MRGTITMSATIVRGACTNRVKVATPPRGKKYGPKKPRPRRYARDIAIRGQGHKVVSVSMSPAELEALDEFARRVQMARSHLIRRAVAHFRAKVMP